ncbi:hypothetical protein GCM10025875_17740 [Litorihabitans aurantiacus]|uniref:YlxR domain-containing protein n=1 Tax=Litorihabitans aurantiacus TaxID=1930061 RepID=A0AA38CTE0_9MICO|nr:hypothetical protein GCM10025875_17740 [Litorihabitans aurantiacus]
MGCRERDSRSGLVRIVAVAGTTQVVLDRRGDAPGRGAWLHARPSCVDRALTRRAVPRALRLQDADASQIEAALRALVAPGDDRADVHERERDETPMGTR